MERDPQTTNAPAPIIFLGQQLLLDPLTLVDGAIIERHLLTLRPNLLSQANRAARMIVDEAKAEAAAISADDPDRDAKAEELIGEAQAQAENLLNRAVDHASRIEKITPDELKPWLDSLDGVAFCCWLKLSQRYGAAKFTLETVTAEFQRLGDESLANYIAARDRVARSGVVASTDGSPSTPPAPIPGTPVEPAGGVASSVPAATPNSAVS
jgi:hypothetical protein